MLVLARKVGESILIGNDIVVKITSMNGTTVRIGIEAPKSVPIFRKEVLERDIPTTGAVPKGQRAGIVLPDSQTGNRGPAETLL